MSAPELVIRSQRVVTPGAVGAAAIHVREGVIVSVARFDQVPAGCELVDAGESVVMPGLVDTHVHINEPGRTEWEGFATATCSAAAGGVTTLIDMPLNSIPSTTTVFAYEQKCFAAQHKLYVDTGFWGGVVPGNAEELRALYEAGVFGFKCFLVPSGADEFPHVTETDLRCALAELAKLGAPLLVHSELPGPVEEAAGKIAGLPAKHYSTWLGARPPEAENIAIDLVVRLCREFDVRIHVVHLSSSDALPTFRAAKEENLPVTVETCPHYLFFSAEDVPDGATEFKCAPPIRERENRERLWGALGESLLDLVATDHSPCPPEMKRREAGDFVRAWGGVASLQLGLPVMWTAMRQRGFSFDRLAQWMCAGPAALAGLVRRKGTIVAGCDADFVVWDPEATFTVGPAMLHHRHKLTPYNGQELAGVVQSTFLRGRKIFARGQFPVGPTGKVLRQGRA